MERHMEAASATEYATVRLAIPFRHPPRKAARKTKLEASQVEPLSVSPRFSSYLRGRGRIANESGRRLNRATIASQGGGFVQDETRKLHNKRGRQSCIVRGHASADRNGIVQKRCKKERRHTHTRTHTSQTRWNQRTFPKTLSRSTLTK
jgi:hypothetical protein